MRHFKPALWFTCTKGSTTQQRISTGLPPLLYSCSERDSSTALCLQGWISLLKRAGTCSGQVGTPLCLLVTGKSWASTAGTLTCFLKQFSHSNKAMCHFCSKSDTDEYSKAHYRHEQHVAPFYERERDNSHHHLVFQQKSQESKLLTRWSARKKRRKKRKLKLYTKGIWMLAY